jgi:hypothetical protein
MWFSSRKSSGNDAFFRGQRKSPWFVVAYGMIGASLSGVTFLSVPGGVYHGQFTYMPLVFGYVLGYIAIALVLLPLYYRLNLTSIYSYLEQRFGVASEKTGALFFIISRLMGSALRMYLVVFVLYEFVFRYWGVPFWIIAVVFILIILLYTFRGGLKTVVWTDTLQTTFLILAAVATVVAILNQLDISLPQLMRRSSEAGYTRIFETDPTAGKYYWKQILSGMFITITMTGLDQDMMQKPDMQKPARRTEECAHEQYAFHCRQSHIPLSWSRPYSLCPKHRFPTPDIGGWCGGGRQDFPGGGFPPQYIHRRGICSRHGCGGLFQRRRHPHRPHNHPLLRLSGIRQKGIEHTGRDTHTSTGSRGVCIPVPVGDTHIPAFPHTVAD